MKIELSKLYDRGKNAMLQEDGQDLTQVALVVALCAVGATASMNSVATAVGSAFSTLSSLVANMGGVLIH
jgi:hypothetical protein